MLERSKIDHVGIAVRDTDQAILQFAHSHQVTHCYRVHDPRQNIRITYLNPKQPKAADGDSALRLELIEGVGPKNPVARWTRHAEITPYHLCYRFDNFASAYKDFRAQGFFPINVPFEPVLEPGSLACHLMHRQYGIVEIVGKKES